MPVVKLEIQPVGVKFIPSDEDVWVAAPLYEGISYCDAVLRATDGEELQIHPDSITTCKWSPVVLGLKNPESGFEKRQEPRLEGTRGVFLAPLSLFETRGLEPDVVIIRDDPKTLRYLAREAGERRSAREYAEELDKSALQYLLENRADWKVRLTMAVNRILAFMQRFGWWKSLIEFMFRSELVSDLFDRVISRTMADMSICRNSTVIPYKTGMANISFFCSGGIAWGMNRSEHMTSGWPWQVFKELRDRVTLTW
jgi:uncharacterized protein (DUF169 family)